MIPDIPLHFIAALYVLSGLSFLLLAGGLYSLWTLRGGRKGE